MVSIRVPICQTPPNSPKTSRNPYRQNLMTFAPPLPRSASEETQSSGRVKPVRAVFHDLPTAHSSITSGTARNRGRRLSNNPSEAYEEEDSIPLRELEPPKRRSDNVQSFLDDLPLPPLPTAIADRRYNIQSQKSDSSRFIEDDNFVSHKEAKPAKPAKLTPISQSNSVLVNVKNAFASISSPVTASTPSNWFGSGRDKAKQRPQYPENGSSIYHSGLGAAPSGSLAPNSAENKQLLDSYGRPQKHSHDSYNEAIPFPNLQRTPASNKESPSLPRQSSKATRVLSNAASSLPEGSTVGNIYRHYANSDSRDDAESDGDDARSEFDLADGYFVNQRPYKTSAENQGVQAVSSSNGQLQGALYDRQQRLAERALSNQHGQTPWYALPNIPNLSPCLLPSSSQGIGNSSSYGDTNHLLDLAEPSHWLRGTPALNPSDARNNLKPDQAQSEAGNSSQPYLSPNNPFRAKGVPLVLVSQASGEDYGHDDHHQYNHTADRQPLERDVSEALRRASNFSTYSNGSIATSIFENYKQFHNQSDASNGMGLLRRQLQHSPPSDPKLINEESRDAARAQNFYEKGAIPSDNWVAAHQHNIVRIPIKQNGQLHTPPISPEDPADLSTQSQGNLIEIGDDGNDWETVGESAFSTDPKGSTPGMLGEGMAHRAGSSIANTSDEGTTSTHIPEISDYGSTERIVQHPGNIQYFGDYRQRDLKNTHIPVFLPSFREHKVNGYLADSNRTRPPPNPYANIPTPLHRKHTNPFNSPPPEVMKVGACKPSSTLSRDQRARNPNHFPTTTSIEPYTSSEESTSPNERITPIPRTRPVQAAEAPSESYNWMDDFDEPGPDINHSKHNFLKPISPVAEEDRPSSWQHIMTYAAGGSVEGYNENGIRLHESPFGTQGGRGIMREHSFSGFDFSGSADVRGKAQANGFVEQKTYGGKFSKDSRERKNTLVKGPPGAFYHNLSRPKKTNRSQSHDTERPPKVKVNYRQSSARDYPTNSLRPLSLVASHQRERPVTPIDNTGEDPSEHTIPNDFVYRSPLAPPKRKSWQKLYTPDQLSEIREAAQSDGIFDTRRSQAPAPNTGLRDSLKEGGSRKHLWESPRLFQFNREPSASTDLAQRKKKISHIVLGLCNLFPPLLLLFGLGAMDGVVNWWTSGETMAFGKGQKRTALILLVIWGCLTFTGLVVFLIYWLTTSHS